MKNLLDALTKDNIDGAKTAAVITAGGVANTQLVKLVSKKAPFAVRGYVNTPLGKLVVANIASQVLKQTRPNDTQLAALSEGMIVSAYQEVMNGLDVNGMIEEFLDQAPVKRAIDTLDK